MDKHELSKRFRDAGVNVSDEALDRLQAKIKKLDKAGKLKPPQRYSKGPLYSKKELARTEQALGEQGFAHTEDNTALGARMYGRWNAAGQKTGEVVIHLDELGCSPNNSGTMIVHNGETAVMTSVWQFAADNAPNLLDRSKKALGSMFRR